MITFESETFRDKWCINHDSDGHGKAIIMNIETEEEFEVPARLLVEFVAEIVRSYAIAHIEAADPESLLFALNIGGIVPMEGE